MYPMEKTIAPLTACLTSFFGKDNYIITLLQTTVIYVSVNSKRVNSENSTPFSFLYNMVRFDDLIVYGKKIRKFQFSRVPKGVRAYVCAT
jgi:hypothetical protein